MILIFYATIKIYSYYKKNWLKIKSALELLALKLYHLRMYNIFSAISITKKLISEF